ncbi:Ras GTPase-activating-like protein IQG1 [Cyberlindnera fabianii]|uniref:Ras GTPase-activating-like protein IQG1 n=1 Tax=Cyberlindnera fabianii TaxID=36022 RepID=A0A1V2L0Q7_CYBFA|nr:Ras GTPase-activating-like protein IQG1 [Cyberlindnera fabianii]
MSSKSVASRYLENLAGSNASPLQPSAKVNTPSPVRKKNTFEPASPTPSKTSTTQTPQRLSPVKRLVLQNERAIPLEESIANLKLDSPSPLKKKSSMSSSTAPPHWTLSNSKSQKSYEYLCRIGEAKEWIEKIIGEEIPSASELAGDALRDGVILAKLTRAFKPEFVKRITPSGAKLQFKHTENINVFFQLLDYVRMPDLFRFELTDLYDKKNIPKVIFCIHALSFMMSQETSCPIIDNLSGKLEFTNEEIKKLDTSLVGVSMPNFDSMNKQLIKGTPSSPQKTILQPLKHEMTPSSPTRNAGLQSPFLDNDIGNAPPPIPKSPLFKRFDSITKKREEKDVLQSPVHLEKQWRATSGEDKAITIDDDEEDYGSTLVRRYSASPTKTKTLSESEYLKTIIQFQSIARGSIFRYGMFVDRIMLKSMSENVIQLQALARRAITLRKHKGSITTINDYEPNVVTLQARIRGKIQRTRITSVTESQPSDKTVELQSLCRGYLVRRQINRIVTQISYNETKMIKLQSQIRRNLVHTRAKNCAAAEEPITKFQSRARCVLLHRKLNRSVREANSSEQATTIIQSVARGNQTRSTVEKKKRVLESEKDVILEMQSIIRAGLSRGKLNKLLDTMDIQEPNINKLVAIVKGKQLRSRVAQMKRDLFKCTQSVIDTQSQVRGVLARYNLEIVLDAVDYHTEEIVEFQSLIRRHLYHKSKKELMKYYEQHLPSIVKIQAFIRGKYLGNAYKSLISMENPPLSVIKKFAYLLNDNDVDFEEEVRLTRLKESINEKTSSNELLEKHISQLDLKIALLQKNKITLDELLLQKNKSIDPHPTQNVSTIDVTSLNRRAKTRMELYEKFFYLLQTQPSYLTRLIHSDYRGVDVSLKIFNNLQSKELPTREEYLFVRLIESTLKDIISKSQSVDELQKHTTLGWQRLLRSFNETQQKPLRDLFGTMVENIIGDTEIDLESDPVIIYKRVHNTPKTLPVEKAIEDAETKAAFISHLQQMREYGSEVFRILSDNLGKIPIHIRSLARAAFRASMKKFPHFTEQEHLSNAGFVLMNGYVNLIFESPEFFHISAINPAPFSSKNRTEIAKVLTQLFIMKPFGSEHVYLQPLNKFINSSVDGVRSLLKSIVDIGEIDTVYNMSVYDDMTAHKRPKLTLRISDMVSINELVKKEIDVIAPLADDTLREVLFEIQSNPASDVSGLSGHYTLSLNPSSYKASTEDTRAKALFMQAKRAILYMVQVQDEYNDLFSLLRSQIDTIHEIKFQQIITTEKKDIQMNRVNEYVNDGRGFLGDLSKISYHTLKQIALERILELETMGQVTRKDSFQILVNEIANDVRTKHDQRLSRKKQLSVAENTLIRLDEKHKFLQDQLNAYNMHIDKSMEELQSKPGKQRRILPFTKQFFYERELKKSGKLPKFGAYKYSSKRLYEKGILVEVRGLDQNLNSSGSSSFFGGFTFPKIDFMFNCDSAGIFTISCKSGTIAMNGSLEQLTIDQLLEYQFENKPQIALFDSMVKFDTNCLINFIFKKFYHYES